MHTLEALNTYYVMYVLGVILIYIFIYKKVWRYATPAEISHKIEAHLLFRCVTRCARVSLAEFIKAFLCLLAWVSIHNIHVKASQLAAECVLSSFWYVGSLQRIKRT